MLIPSIDLQGGAVVQLVQGERLAIKDDDVFRWVRRFERFPEGAGDRPRRRHGQGRQPRRSSGRSRGALSCRVGGGIRTVERARDVLAAGARQIIAGSSLFKDGQPDLDFAKQLADGGRRRTGDCRRGQPGRAGRRSTAGRQSCPSAPWTPSAPSSRSAASSFTRTSMPKASCAAPISKRFSPSETGHHPPRHGRRRHHDAAGNRRPRIGQGVDSVVGMAIYTGTLQVAGPSEP